MSSRAKFSAIVLVVVQILEHRGVASDLKGEVAKVAERVVAKALVLKIHEMGILHFSLGGREVTVPEQHHLFAKRVCGLHHAAYPPAPELLELHPILTSQFLATLLALFLRQIAEFFSNFPADLAQRLEGWLEFFQGAGFLRCEEPFDGIVQAELCERLDFCG